MKEALAIEKISARAAYELISKDHNTRLLDVRSPLEFSQVHIQDSLNIPIDALGTKIEALKKAMDNYIVLCRTGNRSAVAADMLIHLGIQGVKVMEGGITAWQKQGLSVIKGEAIVSLERQVRIIAGSLVLSGILMSWLAHPAFLLVSFFTGCGLIYAGITDNCLMGTLLMKLPYNKKLYKSNPGGGACSIG